MKGNRVSGSSQKIKVGTSGYSFEDWRGTFYPADIDKAAMLTFYTQHFDTVEVNSTYYRILPPIVFERMAAKAPDHFEFIVKVNQATTHEGKDGEVVEKFKASITPLMESGKLYGVLAQFPFRFRNTPENREYLRRCRERMPDVPYFVEFRHKSWLTPQVGELLKEHQLGFVSVDEPKLEGLLPSRATATTDTGYIRLHGRNAAQWWQGGPERYDYSYSEEELREWVEHIRRLIEKARKVYVFFNNCHHGQAAQNAKTMKGMLELALS
jgi:uncharacterized protein YecE (DUF72 family)